MSRCKLVGSVLGVARLAAGAVWLGFLLASMVGCSQPRTPSPSNPGLPDRAHAWPKEWSDHLGQTLILEGTAINAKSGALLQGKGGAVWIDGLDAWPEGFYAGGDQGKRLRVTGTVIKRADLPVFVPRMGDMPRAGIPVQSEEELEKAKWRYLLKEARWTVLE